MSNAAARRAVLQEYCRELKMPAVFRDYPALARQARDADWDYEEFLVQLLEAEIHSRRDHTAVRRLREARFPEIKTFEQLDWGALKGISKPKLLELASCGYIDAHHDLILAGPIGTGKTHIGIALGVEAARRRYRVSFMRAAELVRELLEARDERTLTRLHQRYRRVDLLICDELGFVPFDRAGGELLFNLLSDRYERRSTIVTTNLSFSEWVQVFGDEKLTIALLDRLGHHAQVLTTKGESFRTRKLRQRDAGPEVPPPAP
jgi:DNA replication protein DnaC